LDVFDSLKYDKLVIYGAHLIAENIFLLLRKKFPQKEVEAFVVTDTANNSTEIMGVPVYNANEYFEKQEKNQALSVIVAVPEKYWGEIADNLEKYNILDVYYIGINSAAEMLGSILVEHINSLFKEITADIDDKESFCVNVKLKNSEQDLLFLKLPILMKNPIWSVDNVDDIEKKIVELLNCNIKKMTGKYKETNNKDIDISGFKIYSACSHVDAVLKSDADKDDWCIDVQAGKALTEKRVAALSDDTGFSISQKNQQFAEMTVTYWLWKNESKARYKGLCHYRRKFDLSKNDIQNIINEDVDVVLTMPRVVFPSVKEYFYETPVTKEGFQLLLDVIDEVKPEYYQFAVEYFDGNCYFPNNMAVAKAEIFDEYCKWIFDILFELEKRYSGVLTNCQKRYIAYSAELLTSLFFSYNIGRFKTVCVEYRMRK